MATIRMKKGEQVKDFRTENGKAITTIEVAGKQVSNPTIKMLKADGWVEIIKPTPPPYIPTREEKINAEIRERYTENDEFMIIRRHTAYPANPEYAQAFAEYNTFVESVLAKYPEEDE